MCLERKLFDEMEVIEEVEVPIKKQSSAMDKKLSKLSIGTHKLSQRTSQEQPAIKKVEIVYKRLGYNGAFVFEPKKGIYFKPIATLDYGSLYPSVMRALGLCPHALVMDPAYDNLPGVDYMDIEFDITKHMIDTGGTKHEVVERWKRRFAQKDGITPDILKTVLTQRKQVRKLIVYKTLTLKDGRSLSGIPITKDNKIKLIKNDGTVICDGIDQSEVINEKDTYTEMEKSIFDALQLAYKVVANSIYGQFGANISPIYEIAVAASTTEHGRVMLQFAQDFVEANYGEKCIYGDTDSVFVELSKVETEGRENKEIVADAIRIGKEMEERVQPFLKYPHVLEYEKVFRPFCIWTKKRYVGNLYEDNPEKYVQKNMGIVLKRRDNAPIVKRIFGGALDIILNVMDIEAAKRFASSFIKDLYQDKFSVSMFVLSKKLKQTYKNPSQIVHWVLAERIGREDPGNKPRTGDRVEYVYVQCKDPPNGQIMLQGDRVRTPADVASGRYKVDHDYYFEHQIKEPLTQLFSVTMDHPEQIYKHLINTCRNKLNQQSTLSMFFKKKHI